MSATGPPSTGTSPPDRLHEREAKPSGITRDAPSVFPRRWVANSNANNGGGNQEADDQFTVMSYNILSDLCIKPGEYNYCSEEKRFQNWRHSHIMAEIGYHYADVVCLQEVSRAHLDSVLEADMAGIGYACKYMSSHRRDEGIAMFYKPEKMDLISSREGAIVDLFQAHLKRCDISAEVQRRLEAMVKEGAYIGVLMMKLQHVASGKEMTLGNTHLHWSDFQLPGLAALEAACVIHALKEFSAGKGPILVCGDFNSTPDYSAYQMLSNGILDQAGAHCKIPPQVALFRHDESVSRSPEEVIASRVPSHDIVKKLNKDRWYAKWVELDSLFLRLLPSVFKLDLSLQSAYKAVLGEEPPCTNCQAGDWPGYIDQICVDYFFHTASQLKVTGVLETPSSDHLLTQVALPNDFFPSDHILLMASFKIV